MATLVRTNSGESRHDQWCERGSVPPHQRRGRQRRLGIRPGSRWTVQCGPRWQSAGPAAGVCPPGRGLTQKGIWRSLGPAGRRAWLSVALNHHAYRSPAEDAVGAEYELDGRQVVDENSFYCALGEAVNGPGGYFGWNLDALVDCLRGSWRARPPFALHWRRSDIARLHLLEHKPTATGSAPLLELLLEILHGGGVDVVMC